MQTIGERLEEARKKKGISIREAAEATKIRGDYLQRFESNQFDIGLTEIYTRGFLRNYATYLKLPADRIINDYAALGRGAVRPRQPSREVYGRMDISVATAGESSDRAAPPAPEAVPAPEPQPARPAQPRFPRTPGSPLPAGLDPAVVFRYGKWALAVIALVAVVLVIKALLGGGSPSTPARTPAAGASARIEPGVPTYRLIASDRVFVRVTRLIGNDTDGEEVWSGYVQRGVPQTVLWTGRQNIHATDGEKVQLEINGRLASLNFKGNGHAQLPSPQ
jgi:transcriptional regulator with XRE-family HTH domain